MVKMLGKSARLILSDERKKNYAELSELLGTKTLSKTFDKAVEITLNIYKRGAISQEIIDLLPQEDRGRYATLKLGGLNSRTLIKI